MTCKGTDDDAVPAVDRRRAVALSGHLGDERAARAGLSDRDPAVRAAAVGALARLDALHLDDIERVLADPEPSVRRRTCEVLGERVGATCECFAGPGGGKALTGVQTRCRARDGGAAARLRAALGDEDPTVAEVAAWALGELEDRGSVAALAAMATESADALCREAAVAALGAIGVQEGLPAILGALGDKPAVRRRAVIALAPFDGPEVDAALRRALDDRDWQVRQAAEDLLADP